MMGDNVKWMGVVSECVLYVTTTSFKTTLEEMFWTSYKKWECSCIPDNSWVSELDCGTKNVQYCIHMIHSDVNALKYF